MEGIKQPIYDIVIIGAGLEALHIVLRLPESLKKKTVVVDSSGEWITSWSSWCQDLQIEYLRNPMTLHPSPAPLELQYFAEKRGRTNELLNVLPQHAPIPTSSLVHDFCTDKTSILDSIAILKDTVTNLTFPSSPENDDANTVQDTANACIHLSSGTMLHAKAAIVTASHRKPVIPSWAKKAVESSSPYATPFFSWKRDGNKIYIENPKNNDALNDGDMVGKKVAIIGGGMTAAHLALRAISNGASSVTLIARRSLLLQAFECDVGWWGNKQLNSFWQENDQLLKLKACKRAKMQASIHQPLWNGLVEQARKGTLVVLENVQVEDCCKMQGKEVWTLTLKNTTNDNGTQQQKTSDFQRDVGVDAQENSKERREENFIPTLDDVDIVWLACGSAFNASIHPILSSVQESFATDIIGGYPVLDHETCLWPGAPVYIAGRGALLAVGPCSGDFAGMRLSAERIVKSLKRLEYAGETQWSAALSRTSPFLLKKCDEKEKEDDEQEEDPLLALEEKGLMLIERRTKSKISKPAHLVDISDLDVALPRQEVQKFTFTDDDFEICVILTLPEPIPEQSVRSMITEKSLEIWAVGLQAAYRLYVPVLYGRILPQRSKIKVNQSKKKVYIFLHKEKDAEWRFLKS